MDEFKQQLDRIESMLKQHLAGGSNGASEHSRVADDKLLDGPYGNYEIRIDPRDWVGESYVGTHIASAPLDYLEAAAVMHDRFGEHAKKTGKLDKNGKETAWRDHQKASICRGWIKRKKAAGDDDGINF